MPSPLESARKAGRGARAPRQREDLVYQAVTIGAIVTVLASVWVF